MGSMALNFFSQQLGQPWYMGVQHVAYKPSRCIKAKPVEGVLNVSVSSISHIML